MVHSEITNRENGDVRLRNYFSANISAQADRYYLTQFGGAWAREMGMQESELTRGIKTISSQKQVRAVQLENPSFMLSLDRPSTRTRAMS